MRKIDELVEKHLNEIQSFGRTISFSPPNVDAKTYDDAYKSMDDRFMTVTVPGAEIVAKKVGGTLTQHRRERPRGVGNEFWWVDIRIKRRGYDYTFTLGYDYRRNKYEIYYAGMSGDVLGGSEIFEKKNINKTVKSVEDFIKKQS